MTEITDVKQFSKAKRYRLIDYYSWEKDYCHKKGRSSWPTALKFVEKWDRH
jgi:hypothetical protein